MIEVILENLFSSGMIGSLRIKNRIMRSATFEGRASREGEVTNQLTDFYIDLARGGVGLIITGAVAVDSRITVGSRCLVLNNDSFIPGNRRLVEAVHEFDVKIGPQLAHNGRQGTHPKYKPVAPSPILYKPKNLIPRELTTEEIYDLIKKFAVAGRRAYESGYDLVQLHACHGYLLSSFLSPHTNRRTDEFGGTIEGRAKIFVDIYNQLRDEVGKKFPITAKLQVIDDVPEGLAMEEAKKFVKILVETGYDAIEPSGGSPGLQTDSWNSLPSKQVKKPDDENYLAFAVNELRPFMKNCALIQVGGIRSPLSAEKLLQANDCDFIALSRPLIREPDLPNRWEQGNHTPAQCISCNGCLMVMFAGQPTHCVVKAKLARKKQKTGLSIP